MLPIQRSFWADKKAAIDHGVSIPVVCAKIDLYRAIAQHLGIDTTGMDLDTLWAAIDDRNIELACVGVAESMIEHELTVLDKMAAKIEFKRPVLKRDRKPVPKPVKRGLTVITNRVYPDKVMAKALMNKGLVIVK